MENKVPTTTVRYSDEELLEFKILIDGKLEVARKELDFTRDQIIELNENAGDQQGADWFDDSSIHSELEMLNNMVSRQQLFIRNLENALIRIQNKTYGICTVTGQLIDKKRLQLVPHATKSVSAKEEIQQTAPPKPSISSYSGIGLNEVDNNDDDDDAPRKPAAEKSAERRTPKVTTTKLVKKSSAKASKSKIDEDEEWDDILGAIDDTPADDNDSYEEDDQMMGGMNLDEISEDDSISSYL
ncbi:MAG: hypothetical protein KA010_00735 [Saprospiraceae bacterium]|nr:hypothetical protein [Saprospiraceae bacterium]